MSIDKEIRGTEDVQRTEARVSADNKTGRALEPIARCVTTRTRFFILGPDGEPCPVSDVIEWGRWLEGATTRRVDDTDLGELGRVRTYFLGLNDPEGPGEPLLWETTVSGGPSDGDCWRESSRADAVVRHRLTVEKLEHDVAIPGVP